MIAYFRVKKAPYIARTMYSATRVLRLEPEHIYPITDN